MASSKYKILIVDDNKTFLNLIAELLKAKDKNFSIETARSGKECLKKVQSFSPDLVFLDIGMDGMNGPVTVRFIKSMDHAALVYFLSGYSKEFIDDAAGMVQVDGYFTKTQFLNALDSDRSLADILHDGKEKH